MPCCTTTCLTPLLKATACSTSTLHTLGLLFLRRKVARTLAVSFNVSAVALSAPSRVEPATGMLRFGHAVTSLIAAACGGADAAGCG
jgi:hypothetical protein